MTREEPTHEPSPTDIRVPSPVRVGVLTFHRCINYGSYWQARCMAEGLRSRGLDAVLLDHQSQRVTRAEWKCALQPTLPERTLRSDLPLYAEKARKFFDAFDDLPLSKPFELEAPGDMEPVDVAVVGSDEVWNFRHPWYGSQRLFFGDGLRAQRLVSYAASFGNHDAAHGVDQGWAAGFQRFASISVRDQNSRRLVRTAAGREPALVLDPCLQFSHACRRSPRSDRRPEAIVYGHGFDEGFVRKVKRWAEARKMPLVSIGYRNDWADEQRIAIGPEEFAQTMADVEAIITNFFHGCVFAIVNSRPFLAAVTDYRSNKVRNLTALLGARTRLAAPGTPDEAYAAALDLPPSASTMTRLAAMRRRSSAYLDHAFH